MKLSNHNILKIYINDNEINYLADLYLQSFNIHTLKYLKTKKLFYKLQVGGDKKSITIDKNKFNFELDIYDDNTDVDNKRKEITIVNLKNENIGCGILIIDKQLNEGYIQNVSNYKSCLKCIEKNNNFKVGDTIMQILLILARKNKLKKLKLKDNSQLSCNNINIPLISLRTMTKGEPYYCKYGFTPIEKSEKNIYKHNSKIFNKNPTIDKNILLKILSNKRFSPELLNFIKKNIITELKDAHINISYFIKLLITKIINFNNTEACILLNKIHFKIFDIVGYELYSIKTFELFL
jgi:hypothetical protein